MTSLIGDEQLRPDLFAWNGPIAAAALESWLRSLGRDVPADLRSFWERTGGGEVFETETLLGPLGDRDLGADIASVNAHHRARGMPAEYLVFHVGLGGLSAARQRDGVLVVLSDRDYQAAAEYRSFEHWYLGHIRREYAERYGLPPARWQS
jgi:hypothetical protein